MFKIIGILLSFSACTMTGMWLSQQMVRRKKLLVSFRDLLQRMETEMGYFKDPLPLIFQGLTCGNSEPTDILLRQCIQQMETGGGSIKEIWDAAVKMAYQDEPLKDGDMAILMKCGLFIGQSDFEGQKGYFELIDRELTRQIEDASETVQTKGSLCSKAGLAVGAVLAIVLL